MAQDKKISELEHKSLLDITGAEMLPFEDENGNGNVTLGDVKEYASQDSIPQSNITQATGQSTEQVMSQKAVTRELTSVRGELSDLDDAISAEQNARQAADTSLNQSIEDLRSEVENLGSSEVAIAIDETTGVISLISDSNSDITDAYINSETGVVTLEYTI